MCKLLNKKELLNGKNTNSLNIFTSFKNPLYLNSRYAQKSKLKKLQSVNFDKIGSLTYKKHIHYL